MEHLLSLGSIRNRECGKVNSVFPRELSRQYDNYVGEQDYNRPTIGEQSSVPLIVGSEHLQCN